MACGAGAESAEVGAEPDALEDAAAMPIILN
jgi:hypothetical protein